MADEIEKLIAEGRYIPDKAIKAIRENPKEFDRIYDACDWISFVPIREGDDLMPNMGHEVFGIIGYLRDYESVSDIRHSEWICKTEVPESKFIMFITQKTWDELVEKVDGGRLDISKINFSDNIRKLLKVKFTEL